MCIMIIMCYPRGYQHQKCMEMLKSTKIFRYFINFTMDFTKITQDFSLITVHIMISNNWVRDLKISCAGFVFITFIVLSISVTHMFVSQVNCFLPAFLHIHHSCVEMEFYWQTGAQQILIYLILGFKISKKFIKSIRQTVKTLRWDCLDQPMSPRSASHRPKHAYMA